MSVDLETQVRQIIEKMGKEGGPLPAGQTPNPIGDLVFRFGAIRTELQELKGRVHDLEGKIGRLEAQ